jgi:excisionase family DNA binding protein
LDHQFLTADEVAELLRISVQDVHALVDEGELLSLRVLSHLRIPTQSVLKFVAREARSQQERMLRRAFDDPHRWGRILAEQPSFAAEIEGHAYSPGSMGAWLQEALRIHWATLADDNVVPFRPSKDDD